MVVEQLENQLKLGNLEASVHGFSKGKSRLENLKAIMTHLEGLKLTIRLSHVSGEVIQPNPGAKQFSPICILNFSTQGFEYQAEWELSRARKAGRTKLSCTRPTPKFDLNDVKKEDDVCREIIGYFEVTLFDQGKGDWCLTDEGRKLAISTRRLSKRHTKSPTFSLFYEFLEPTSNICFLHYYLGRNPFASFDFTANIPNIQSQRHWQVPTRNTL